MSRDTRPANNTVYIASEELKFGPEQTCVAGAGYFPMYDSSLRLTAHRSLRSRWELPAWFHPEGRPPTL